MHGPRPRPAARIRGGGTQAPGPVVEAGNSRTLITFGRKLEICFLQATRRCFPRFKTCSQGFSLLTVVSDHIAQSARPLPAPSMCSVKCQARGKKARKGRLVRGRGGCRQPHTNLGLRPEIYVKREALLRPRLWTGEFNARHVLYPPIRWFICGEGVGASEAPVRLSNDFQVWEGPAFPFAPPAPRLPRPPSLCPHSDGQPPRGSLYASPPHGPRSNGTDPLQECVPNPQAHAP